MSCHNIDRQTEEIMENIFHFLMVVWETVLKRETEAWTCVWLLEHMGLASS